MAVLPTVIFNELPQTVKRPNIVNTGLGEQLKYFINFKIDKKIIFGLFYYR